MIRKHKRSFFERLTGTINTNGLEDEMIEEENAREEKETRNISVRGDAQKPAESGDWLENDEGQLTVDVYQTPAEIIIKTMVAGVKPDTLDLQISRDMITIKGSRHNSNEIREDDYFYQELFWGTFSRTILLPAEIDIEGAEATEEHGLLTLRLPKIDKDKKTKIRVRSTK
ncbi:hypothetical protein COV42_01400 [Candidatus Campbellbacteria bacterium CG11_big_fil_rev_8_21_14_0_20_44_21]|uniref:SHSP domain-containing protein n=1 Tax=Candidatus Campbellbacteria bacterium CG22_combo_CG10-13_8_21_14_all_43_18 TaxID=1974530 RepID=A0A2H0DXN8_9BACT|nr:MAG: hypothetical protein COW82_00310 [Candidatus Campbellbacteria bacterium CG22_combo_CG10-13_8_21_14_all_43_18]PIR24315.1 MAG: hypothetical protein COV42_01400 [Candidatus Campbellbacteria bacterium CG11_big_fil_rev_8_21_14_0_20_44_21]